MTFPQEILPEIISYLQSLQSKGIKSIYLKDDSLVKGTPAKTERVIDGEAKEEKPTRKKMLLELENRVADCKACSLHRSRRNTVFGVGDAQTKVMFIGEAPGRDEDLKGEPFVGRAGQLLNKILEAVEMKRNEVYITNILKCRPPDNRDPAEEEVRCCEKYLIAQIGIIKPRLICALGRVAAQWLLRTNAPLSALRPGEHTYEGIPVIVTYHPAALLRQPGLKRGSWEDFKKLKGRLEGFKEDVNGDE